jgi:alpha-beta hydrolase superfamily lysophospholipase
MHADCRRFRLSSTDKHTVIFIHGLWLHPQSWRPWVELFDKNGYAAAAPGWPGIAETVEATRAAPNDIAGRGIEEVTDRYRQVISGMERLPIVIGHSFGGMVAEKLLREEQAAAVIAIDAVESKGALPQPLSELYSTLPVFRDPAVRHESIALSKEQFRSSFGNAIAAEESDDLWERWAIPAPGLPLVEAGSETFTSEAPADVAADTTARGPLLLVVSGQEHKLAGALTKAALKESRRSRAETDVQEFPDRGHSLTIDHGWEDVAGACLSWLEQHGM